LFSLNRLSGVPSALSFVASFFAGAAASF